MVIPNNITILSNGTVDDIVDRFVCLLGNLRCGHQRDNYPAWLLRALPLLKGTVDNAPKYGFYEGLDFGVRQNPIGTCTIYFSLGVSPCGIETVRQKCQRNRDSSERSCLNRLLLGIAFSYQPLFSYQPSRAPVPPHLILD